MIRWWEASKLNSYCWSVLSLLSPIPGRPRIGFATVDQEKDVEVDEAASTEGLTHLDRILQFFLFFFCRFGALSDYTRRSLDLCSCPRLIKEVLVFGAKD